MHPFSSFSNEQSISVCRMGIKILFLQNTNINNECRGAIPVLKCFAGLGPKLSKLNDEF